MVLFHYIHKELLLVKNSHGLSADIFFSQRHEGYNMYFSYSSRNNGNA